MVRAHLEHDEEISPEDALYVAYCGNTDGSDYAHELQVVRSLREIDPKIPTALIGGNKVGGRVTTLGFLDPSTLRAFLRVELSQNQTPDGILHYVGSIGVNIDSVEGSPITGDSSNSTHTVFSTGGSVIIPSQRELGESYSEFRVIRTTQVLTGFGRIAGCRQYARDAAGRKSFAEFLDAAVPFAGVIR
jgi:hypothetical protein